MWNSHKFLDPCAKSCESESVYNISTSNSNPLFGIPACNGAENGLEWKATNISGPLEGEMREKERIMIRIFFTFRTHLPASQGN